MNAPGAGPPRPVSWSRSKASGGRFSRTYSRAADLRVGSCWADRLRHPPASALGVTVTAHRPTRVTADIIRSLGRVLLARRQTGDHLRATASSRAATRPHGESRRRPSTRCRRRTRSECSSGARAATPGSSRCSASARSRRVRVDRLVRSLGIALAAGAPAGRGRYRVAVDGTAPRLVGGAPGSVSSFAQPHAR